MVSGTHTSLSHSHGGAMLLKRESGFTLIEVMITMGIAMTILAGLLMSFLTQSTQFKFQDKRVDTAQDLEFALRFIARDLQGAVIGVGSDTLIPYGSPLIGIDPFTVTADGYTGTASPTATMLSFYVWDESVSSDPYTKRALRCYQFRPPDSTVGDVSTHGQLYYNPNASSCDVGGSVASGYGQVLGESADGIRGMQMTHFRVFQDNYLTDRVGYSDIPKPLPTKIVRDENNKTYNMPGFTILIEVEVDARYETYEVSPIDVLGNDVPNNKFRLWRYIQVHPYAVVLQ